VPGFSLNGRRCARLNDSNAGDDLPFPDFLNKMDEKRPNKRKNLSVSAGNYGIAVSGLLNRDDMPGMKDFLSLARSDEHSGTT
jgi:hypothetical protein